MAALFNALLDVEVSALAFVSRLFRDMYVTKGNVDNMNKISPVTFGLVQRALIADVIRRICAVTDPPGAGARQNLVLERAAELFASERGGVPPRVREAIDEAASLTKDIRELRNKTYAHLDLLTKQQKGANLPTVLNADFDAAVQAVFRAMTAIQIAENGSNVVYEMAMINNAGGEFEWLLRDGLRFENLRKLAADRRISDAQFRELARHRSSRFDTRVLGTNRDVIIDDEESD
jgi:hypothetical protein